jgi:hypothetical protein
MGVARQRARALPAAARRGPRAGPARGPRLTPRGAGLGGAAGDERHGEAREQGELEGDDPPVVAIDAGAGEDLVEACGERGPMDVRAVEGLHARGGL